MPLHLVCANQLHSGNAVAETLLVKRFQGRQLVLTNGHHKVANPFKSKMQISSEFIKHGVATHIYARFEGIGDGVVPGVDDGRISAGGAHADVGFLLNQQHLVRISAEFAGDKTTHNPTANDQVIINFRHLTSNSASECTYYSLNGGGEC